MNVHPIMESIGGSFLIIAVVLALAVVVAAAVLLRLWRRRGQVEEEVEPALRIDLAEFEETGPPESAARLEFYNVPVRLVVLVMAPVGRGGEPPPAGELVDVINQLAPGLGDLAVEHDALVKVWPAQLSSRGFANKFFANVALPGDHGKGTAWCSLAGRFEADGRPLLAGLVLQSAAENSLSQYVVEREAQWFDMLRIRR